MSSTSLPLKFAFLFSLSLASAASLTTTAAFPLQFRRRPRTKSSCSLSPTTRHKAKASDLLSLLGPPQQAESVNSQVARDLWSCFKFLVPYNQTPTIRRRRSQNQIDELVLWPPVPVLELARLALDSGADPGAIHRALDPIPFPVPDVEGSNEDRCELTRTPYGRQFIDKRGPLVGLNVSLSRYDFFHGHLFIAKESGRLGILFHAKEYPAYDKNIFPCNMGYCQLGSNVAYDDSMNLRNILWLAPLPSNSTKSWLAPGVLVVLDASPEGIIYKDLIPKYVHIARTLYEEDFGEVVVDVNYLNVGANGPKFQLFIC
ncbi:hypothetical protein CASFOL_026231 [Castilleja foliolosa]|uniref:Uncharacterized protein n=1 Tax=Castilleja foliolosa TaxID=1961234 RepID=A0ABD3CKW6_9LAMI